VSQSCWHRGGARIRSLFPIGIQQGIDESFLAELDEHRLTLAKGFKNKNPNLDSETLTELVQRTLDRLVFIRFLEDKGIEPARMVEAFGESDDAWEDFIGASRRLDGIYDGIVYKHHDILDNPRFRADEKSFADICEKLAHINSPYDFNAIPIHILGSIYERFLGKVIIATDKRANVEEKPEVRKAGGVYYTPEYIVRYIVENTVGKLIAGKSPDQIAEMRFADIACGSGSFLLGVYDMLLECHGRYYNNNPGKARQGDCIERDGKLYLSLHKKREILLNNIYGVDIDAQAVEVCQLSLYLKLLQEETEASARQYSLDFEHVKKMQKLLPDLGKNIICGNSLIGTDILEGQLFGGAEERKLNPMNFEDAFPEVMKRGGFDAVVGNPPYGATIDEHAKDYIQKRYVCQNYQLDSYLLFLERAVKDVLKQGGFYGMIIPNPWLTNILQTNTRRFVTQNTRIMEIVHFKFPVFSGVTVDTQIVLLQRDRPANWRARVTVARTQKAFEGGTTGPEILKLEHDQDRWRSLDGGVINIFILEAEVKLATKVASKGVPAVSLFDINVGIKPYQIGKGTPPQTKQIVETRPFDSSKPVTKLHRPYLRGSDIARYIISPEKPRYLKYGSWLAEPRPAANFDAPAKILMRQTGDSIVAAIDYEQYLCLNNMHVLVPKNSEPSIKYCLGVLNSKLLNWYYHTLNPEVGEALAEVKRANVATLPIHQFSFSDAADKARHDDIAAKVEATECVKHFRTLRVCN